jgi:aminoglycoside phosphotransferase (APT) family kinase protein
MRVLDIRTVLGEIFVTEPDLTGPVEEIAFIHRSECDVYRVMAGGRRFIAHVSPDGTEYLHRLRANLDRVALLDDERIPRIAACREASGEWGLLLCREIPGEEMSRASATRSVLRSLADLLLRLHSIEEPRGHSREAAGRVSDPEAFDGFAKTLTDRLSDLPIRMERVTRHLGAMSRYLDQHADKFRVTGHLIHGDLHRSNIIVCGSEIGLLDWGDLAAGDYSFDLGVLKFVLDSVAPEKSTHFIREQARLYRERFQDTTLEIRMRFFLALAGLIRAFHCADDSAAFGPGRAWRVRACYLHSEAQWRSPLRLDGPEAGAPAARTEDWAVTMRQPMRGLVFLLAPKRIS